MKTLKPEMQVFMNHLQDRKLKLTAHRELILETFLNNEGHRSVEDIYRTVKEMDPRIGYTTVYRAVKLLTECGLAREVELADGVPGVGVEELDGEERAAVGAHGVPARAEIGRAHV